MAFFLLRSLRILVVLVLASQLSAAQEIHCKPQFGSGIDPRHCTVLIQEYLIRHAVLATDGSISLRKAFHNLDKDNTHTFSRDPTVSKIRWCTLPQCLSWQTCAIGFDSPGPHGFSAKWLNLAKTMESFVKQCVAKRGVGGVLKTNNYHIVVTNPAEGLAEGICTATPKQLPMSLARWINAEASGKLAPQSPAGHSPGSSSGSLDAGDLGPGTRGDGTYSRANGLRPQLGAQGLSPTRLGSASSAAGSSEQGAGWDQPHSPPNRLRINQNGQRFLRIPNGHSPPRRGPLGGSDLPPIPEPAEANDDEEAIT